MIGLNWFENWILNKILIKLVIHRNMIPLFSRVYDVHREIYYEDNHFDRKEQLTELLDKVLLNKENEIINNFIG